MPSKNWGEVLQGLAAGLRRIDASITENKRYKEALARQALLDSLAQKQYDLQVRRQNFAERQHNAQVDRQLSEKYAKIEQEDMEARELSKIIDPTTGKLNPSAIPIIARYAPGALDNVLNTLYPKPVSKKEPTGFKAEAGARKEWMSPEDFNAWLSGGIKQPKTPKIPPNIVADILKKSRLTNEDAKKEEIERIWNQDYLSFLPSLQASYPGVFTNAADSIPRQLQIGQYAPPEKPSIFSRAWNKVFGNSPDSQVQAQSITPDLSNMTPRQKLEYYRAKYRK